MMFWAMMFLAMMFWGINHSLNITRYQVIEPQLRAIVARKRMTCFAWRTTEMWDKSLTPTQTVISPVSHNCWSCVFSLKTTARISQLRLFHLVRNLFEQTICCANKFFERHMPRKAKQFVLFLATMSISILRFDYLKYLVRFSEWLMYLENDWYLKTSWPKTS